jgi:hypothetical protein
LLYYTQQDAKPENKKPLQDKHCNLVMTANLQQLKAIHSRHWFINIEVREQ